MLSLKDLFFSKILLIKQYVTNVQIIEGVGIKEKIVAEGKTKTFGGIMLENHYITRKQYTTVMKIQRQTLLTCKSCGLKYHLDELDTEDFFQCEICDAIILRLEELGSLNLEPLFRKASSFDSKIIETASFLLESLPDGIVSDSTASPKAEDMVDLTRGTTRLIHKEPAAEDLNRTTKLRFDKLQDESDLLIGKILGKYEVLSKLGEGGSCVVFLARPLDQDGLVAMKVLKNSNEVNQKVVDRLIREVHVASMLHHPNIVQVLDSGSKDGYYYIIMEYVEGETLRQKILTEQYLPVGEALRIIEQVAQGLAAAHNQNFVHRDIKPDNIMIDQEGVPKIADFGLAKGKAIDVHITQTGQIVGTPYYMSPEQAQTSSLDHRSDIYSLGVTFYYILTGRVPFEGTTPIEIILKHISTQPAPIRDLNSKVPPGLARIIHKMMAKSKEQRYQNALDLLDDLKKLKEISLRCRCGAHLSYSLNQGGTLQKCSSCKKYIIVPLEGGQQKSRSFTYPTWRDFVVARILEEKKFLSREEAVEALKILMDAYRWGIRLSLYNILEARGLSKRSLEETKITLELEIDVKNFPFLFGQLALQLGLINRDELLASLFIQKEKSPPPKLSDLLIQQGLISPADRDSVLAFRRRLMADQIDTALLDLLRDRGNLLAEKLDQFREELRRVNHEAVTKSLPQLLLERKELEEPEVENLLFQCFFQNLYKFS